MAIRIVGFLVLALSALALVPYGAHLFALPNKIAMTQEQYFVAQMAYRGWSAMGFILFPAMLAALVFAYLVRNESPGFVLAAIGCVLMASTLAVFFIWTYPANVATQNWTVAPANWQELRTQWEYSHAANAALIFAAYCLIAFAALAPRR